MLVNKFTPGHSLLVCSFLWPFFIYTPEREFLLLSPPPCLLWSSEKEKQTMPAGGWPGCACCGCVGFLLVVGGHAGRRGISHGFDLFFYLFIYRLCLFQFFQGVFNTVVRLAQEGVPFAGLPAPWEQRGGCGCGMGAPGSKESRNCLLRHRSDVTRSGAAAQEQGC